MLQVKLCDPCLSALNQSINTFITRHGTEARATVEKEGTEKERKGKDEEVNGQGGKRGAPAPHGEHKCSINHSLLVVTYGQFRSCDKDGGHTIRSAIAENPKLSQANIITNTQILNISDRLRQTETDRQTQTDRHTDRQTDKHTDRQTHRETD